MSICSIRSSKWMPGFAAVSDERVEIHDHQIDEPDAVLLGELEVLGVMTAREDAAVDHRMQRLDAAVHHLGEPGDVRDVDDRQAGIGERFGGAAGRDQLESTRRQTTAEFNQARLIRHTENGSFHGRYVCD